MTHSALKRLKSMDINLMRVNEADMEFLKHVLSSATTLERNMHCDERKFQSRGMKMMEEMKQFPRASPNVEFIYQEVDIHFRNF